MNVKLNSEYKFTKQINEKEQVSLSVYINYADKTYDITQYGQEGIFYRHNNKDVRTNEAYTFLALEALDFINNELYLDDDQG
jgi:hypothetical protein